MAITATVNSIARIGHTDSVEVQVTFSDGANKAYTFQLPTDRPTIRQEIKADIDRLNQIDGQVTQLQPLVGQVVS